MSLGRGANRGERRKGGRGVGENGLPNAIASGGVRIEACLLRGTYTLITKRSQKRGAPPPLSRSVAVDVKRGNEEERGGGQHPP